MNFIEPIYRFEMKQRQEKLKRLSILEAGFDERSFLKRMFSKGCYIYHLKKRK